MVMVARATIIAAQVVGHLVLLVGPLVPLALLVGVLVVQAPIVVHLAEVMVVVTLVVEALLATSKIST